jgi:hypothetical protein
MIITGEKQRTGCVFVALRPKASCDVLPSFDILGIIEND